MTMSSLALQIKSVACEQPKRVFSLSDPQMACTLVYGSLVVMHL